MRKCSNCSEPIDLETETYGTGLCDECEVLQMENPVEFIKRQDEYLKDFDQVKEDAMTLKWLNEGDE